MTPVTRKRRLEETVKAEYFSAGFDAEWRVVEEGGGSKIRDKDGKLGHTQQGLFVGSFLASPVVGDEGSA